MASFATFCGSQFHRHASHMWVIFFRFCHLSWAVGHVSDLPWRHIQTLAVRLVLFPWMSNYLPEDSLAKCQRFVLEGLAVFFFGLSTLNIVSLLSYNVFGAIHLSFGNDSPLSLVRQTCLLCGRRQDKSSKVKPSRPTHQEGNMTSTCTTDTLYIWSWHRIPDPGTAEQLILAQLEHKKASLAKQSISVSFMCTSKPLAPGVLP